MKLLDTRKPMKLITWDEPVNVENPRHYTDDFTSDKGYFTEGADFQPFKHAAAWGRVIAAGELHELEFTVDMTNETHLICGSGFCEHAEIMRKDGYHHAQRQHIYSIAKKDLKATELTPV